MGRHLYYFRPGEEARMLARCQFGARDGRCGATLTYPIKGYPWRHNVMKSYEFSLDEQAIEVLFTEVARIRKEHPEQCLAPERLWNDASEKANSITRDKSTGTLCYAIATIGEDGKPQESFSLREDSSALLSSALFRTISELIAPHETLHNPGQAT